MISLHVSGKRLIIPDCGSFLRLQSRPTPPRLKLPLSVAATPTVELAFPRGRSGERRPPEESHLVQRNGQTRSQDARVGRPHAGGQAGLVTGSSSQPYTLKALSASPFQVRIEMRRHEARSTGCQTCLTFVMGPRTPCLLISTALTFRYTGQCVFSGLDSACPKLRSGLCSLPSRFWPHFGCITHHVPLHVNEEAANQADLLAQWRGDVQAALGIWVVPSRLKKILISLTYRKVRDGFGSITSCTRIGGVQVLEGTLFRLDVTKSNRESPWCHVMSLHLLISVCYGGGPSGSSPPFS